jgi:BirA family biotin operon repressor/biotin-[acetyl-CoA-carboxylase] ligase
VLRAAFSRVERFGQVGSTNDVVRSWLAAGTPEIAVASAAEQTAGRGRAGRTWLAPADSSLLVSVGYRPTYLLPEETWRLGAVTSLAMAEAAEQVAELPAGTIRLKWPNDLVVEDAGGIRKIGGVLGETDGLGTDDVRAVVGVGFNVDWGDQPIPPELVGSMASLATAVGRPLTAPDLLDAFLGRLEATAGALRRGAFGIDDWTARQVTTGRSIVLELPGGERASARAEGVDPDSGALLVATAAASTGVRPIHAAEVVHVRLAGTQV